MSAPVHSSKVENTKGTKELNSTSLILCSYFLRFSFLNRWYNEGTEVARYDGAVRLKTFTSKYVLW